VKWRGFLFREGSQLQLHDSVVKIENIGCTPTSSAQKSKISAAPPLFLRQNVESPLYIHYSAGKIEDPRCKSTYFRKSDGSLSLGTEATRRAHFG